jgi:hypothetical protein
MDWIVAGVILVGSMIGIAGLYLGLADPVTRPYRPQFGAYFGRAWRSPVSDRR